VAEGRVGQYTNLIGCGRDSMRLAEAFFVPCFSQVRVDKRAVHRPKQRRRVRGRLRATEQAAARVANAPVGMRVLMAVLGRWSSMCAASAPPSSMCPRQT
jgi:hypothetical protein